MIHSLRAELVRLLHWPITWLLGGIWLALNLSFGYLFLYLSYRDNSDGFAADASDPESARAVLVQMMPDSVPATMLSQLPMFGGGLVLLLGALAVGSGYPWGTWKTVFMTGQRRSVAVAGTLAALAVIVTGFLVVTFAVDLLASYLIATAESEPVIWPSPAEVARGLGGALLIGGTWTAGGVLLGTLTRGPALATGLGLLWVLVVEHLLRGVAEMLGPVEAVTDVLPGTAAGSLAGAIGALPQSDPNGTPGVLTTIGGTAAAALLGAYLVAFTAASLALKARRDVTN
ncbi:ABC transporter permease [Micromonospora sp. BQ11]|uniref:ABC transporter permease n=1 Tax=Micromonospora sp. BQ11 TaxID=3452212 RepID=UPI003F8B341F